MSAVDFKPVYQLHGGKYYKEGNYKSIRDVAERINRISPDKEIFAELNDKKEIVHITCHELYEEIMCLGDGLMDKGFKDAHIAIISDNSIRYIIADMCISSGVGVVIPLDKDAPDELLETLLVKCDADAIMCSANCVVKARKMAEKIDRIKAVITMYKKADGCLFWDDIVARGRELKDKSVYRNLTLDMDAPAKMLFTSGTTGANKCVVLSNANLAANCVNTLFGVKAMDSDNTSMSVLPMHHATEINTHIMSRVASGDLTYINDSMRNLMQNIKIFKPSVITIVPMIANAFYKNIWANAEKAGKADKLRKGIKISNLLRRFGIDKTHKMFAEIHEVFGGNLQLIVCGGSMLNPVVVKGLNDLGIYCENGYGITECGPLISLNADTLEDCRSVGKPVPGIEAKILNPDEDGIGDLCVKGPSVSKGYYKDPKATAEVFSEDGFFNTGDSARIDSEGRIFLVGRKKNTIVLPSGKNVCPEEVENIIESNIDYASDIVVYQAETSNGNQVLCAGLYIPDEQKRTDREGIIADFKRINAILPSYKNIDCIELAGKEYEKTSTKKIKRASIGTACSDNCIKVF